MERRTEDKHTDMEPWTTICMELEDKENECVCFDSRLQTKNERNKFGFLV